MTYKKAHEVENFASFVNGLADEISVTPQGPISHLLDFGSGQNYLGRVLASPMYSHQVIAVERKHSNVDGARRMDVTAKLSKKEVVWRNKKQWRATGIDTAQMERETQLAEKPTVEISISNDHPAITIDHQAGSGLGRVLHIEHDLRDGNLDFVVQQLSGGIRDQENTLSGSSGRENNKKGANDNRILCISLHSCGNLSHHGIRSLVMNSFVKGVALVGCCYNLVTERLGPPTYKLPSLRTANERLERTSSSCDPHGFPMSERMATYEHPYGKGIRLNITARMMAVQAPENWTESECESFFTRHFYRALLQKIFLDKGFVDPPTAEQGLFGGVSPAGFSGGGHAVILGALRKSCYNSFISYVRGAISKLENDPERGAFLLECMNGLTDDEIASYEREFQHKRHHICLVWSLMAFSAAVVEAAIVTDRWLFLAEQPSVRDCWVQTVFDYKQSPRNLVVVGLK